MGQGDTKDSRIMTNRTYYNAPMRYMGKINNPLRGSQALWCSKTLGKRGKAWDIVVEGADYGSFVFKHRGDMVLFMLKWSGE